MYKLPKEFVTKLRSAKIRKRKFPADIKM